MNGDALDADLDAMQRDELVAEVRRLRAAIRVHRDSTGHELCWHQPELWALLPETLDASPRVPGWAEFLRGCVSYRESLDRQVPNATRTSKCSEAPDARPPTGGE